MVWSPPLSDPPLPASRMCMTKLCNSRAERALSFMHDLTLRSRRLCLKLAPVDGCWSVWHRSATVSSVICPLPERSIFVNCISDGGALLMPPTEEACACPAKCRSMTHKPRKPTSVRCWPRKLKPPSAMDCGSAATGQRFRRAIAPNGKSFHSMSPGNCRGVAPSFCAKSLPNGRPLSKSRCWFCAISATACSNRLAPRPDNFSSDRTSSRTEVKLRSASVMYAKVPA
mmetsp:Transcript_49857/g.133879  ORF Transcript_49857/g.133879 Transcript_49857/m.133879 type:complete len:228 (+) Transcript_49857:1029-1712(+)